MNAALHATLVALAGPEFTWSFTPRNCDRPSGGKRRGGRVRVGMLLWHVAAQGGVCPHCDDVLYPEQGNVDLAHVVGSGERRKGFMAGNIYAAHAGCNTMAYRTRGMDNGYRLILTPGDFRHPEVIQTEWPTDTVGGFIKYDPAFGTE